MQHIIWTTVLSRPLLRLVLLRLFAQNAIFDFFSEYAVYVFLKTYSFTLRFCQKRTVSLHVYSENAFSPKTLNTIWKALLRRQRIGSRLVFGDNTPLCYTLSAKTGNDRKFRISGWIWKRFSKMLVILSLTSINDWRMQKGFKTDYEISCMCTFI